MAGIGFELRKVLRKNTLLSYLEAYGLAAIIGSGPWALSIIALLLIGILSIGRIFPTDLIIQFLVMVTYLMAASLIISGFFQLMLTRFISDLIFKKREDLIIPNLFGCLTTISLASGVLGWAVSLFSELSPAIELTLICGLVVLTNLWIIIVFLSGMKQYYKIVFILFIGYCLMVLGALVIPPYGLLGLLQIFVVAQAVITFTLLVYVVREYPSSRLVSFEFLNGKQAFYSLAFCGLFYNIGVWIDKFVFWFHPDVSFNVVSMFRASYIYDLPIFIAYLAIIPGMAVFVLHMETDFADSNERFYHAVREGRPLHEIYMLKDQMVLDGRNSLFQIFKVQGITLALLLLWSDEILGLLGIDLAYLHLLYVDLVGVSLQVLVMAILNVMFYLDKRYISLILITVMMLSNLLLSWLSIQLGAQFYGYGFALSMLLATLLGIGMLNRKFERLEYETFMLQRS
ncbi:MAG: exopolysaccharide Pel transporter PelG [Pseudidiomarina maritima]|uniref:exopolysaccharide Pel transporter PelG n=1 Tax=Pseudidiomarina donghaiensis TaxID=519452 RepID=UPI0029AF7FA1|nr:exopolysaccharide Pel transporter PelG [Pseudidiomarina maritima]